MTRMSGRPRSRLEDSQGFQRSENMVRTLLKWLFWTTFVFTGCVVPVAPDFQDPASVPNYQPQFLNSDPFFETTGWRSPQTFKVQVADPNPGDTLYVRWVSDYPPFTQAASLLLKEMTLPPQGTPATEIKYDTSLPNSMACLQLLPGLEHRLVVIVSDRPFLSTEQFNNSPFRFNLPATMGVTSTIMQGWSVTCP